MNSHKIMNYLMEAGVLAVTQQGSHSKKQELLISQGNRTRFSQRQVVNNSTITAILRMGNGFEISAGYRFRFLLLLFLAGNMQRKEASGDQVDLRPGRNIRWIFQGRFLFASFSPSQNLKKKKPDIFIRFALKRFLVQKTINQQITASKNNVF